MPDPRESSPPATSNGRGPLRRRAFQAGMVALFLLQCAHGLATLSGTADELGAHLPAGILYWKSGSFSGGVANPPVGQLLVAAGPVITGSGDHPLREAPADLLPARIPNVLLGAALVLLVGLLAREVGGPLAGLAASAATALSPDLIAHSCLATLDLPVTAFAVFSGWLAWRWARDPRGSLLLAFALAVGTASGIKLTALHLIPAISLGAWLLPGTPGERTRRAGTLGLAAVAGVVLVAWASFGLGPARWGLPADWVQAVLEKWEHGREGHLSYLLGERSAQGFPHYFLVALAVKTPLAILAGALAGSIALLRSRPSAARREFVAFVIGPAVWIFLAMSLVHRVDIGLRHVLPAIPAVLAVAGVGWAWLWQRRGAARGAAVLLVLSLAVTAARISPHHLSYFHELAGGPERADRILVDSNLDWGQDEGAFRDWARNEDVTVNPPRPTDGQVAVNVNALHGALQSDDLRLRWFSRLPVERRIGHTWRIARADEAVLRRAAASDPVAALDFAWWLVGVGRATEALPLLDRNDLSSHARHGVEWWRVRAEALLALERFAEAADAASRGGDADLSAEATYRRLGRVDAVRAPLVVAALARRGQRDDARALGQEMLGFDPLEVRAVPAGVPSWNEIARQKSLGQERIALRLAGELLAREPTNGDALALYGELVVRRKLGLTEYEWPTVDWSGVQRGASR